MKLAFIEVAGFRGFKDKTRLDLPGGFVVLTGRNGVGKSTVLDAVDFVLTGTINKYSVKGAKGGGLDEHIWWVGEGTPENQYVSVGFVDGNGEEFVATRSRERGLDIQPNDIVRLLCVGESTAQAWPEILMQTTLIRDETIAALSLDLPEQARAAAVRAAIGGLAGPDHTKRTGTLLETAKAARVAQSERVSEAQAELGRALGALTEARSAAERQADVSEAERIIRTFAPDLAAVPGDRAEILLRRIADRKQSIPALAEALALAEDLEAERLYLESESGLAEIAAARAVEGSARLAKEHAKEKLIEAQRIAAAEQENDAFASHMAALLDHGEAVGLQNGHCPLCDVVRSSEQFTAAIAAVRSNLSVRVARATRAIEILDQARLAMQQAETMLTEAGQQLRDLEVRRAGISHGIARVVATFSRWELAVPSSEPEAARRLMLQRQEETAQLEHALFVLEASSAHDRVTALEARLQHLRSRLDEETAKMAAVERVVETARQIDSAAKEVANQILTEQFDTVMPLLKELYVRLRPHTDWREIETDFGGRVRASLNFTVGDGRNPQFLFSSGQRRAAGIAFLLAIHLSRPWCRLRSLLLDDPVQHIDDYRALNLVEVLSAVRKTGRQVIVAVEDPALADVLCRRLRSTPTEFGRRFEFATANNGSASIERKIDIFPLPRQVLQAVEA
ncbi:MAG: AAA family ATPase [Nitrospirota bacterium]|nr:AAA family ATPase [Nitrospirota bacterium]